jgi:hypothetical protein
MRLADHYSLEAPLRIAQCGEQCACLRPARPRQGPALVYVKNSATITPPCGSMSALPRGSGGCFVSDGAQMIDSASSPTSSGGLRDASSALALPVHHASSCFSTCTGFPYSEDVPGIDPREGGRLRCPQTGFLGPRHDMEPAGAQICHIRVRHRRVVLVDQPLKIRLAVPLLARPPVSSQSISSTQPRTWFNTGLAPHVD